MRSLPALLGALALAGACNVDYTADDGEYQRKLCELDAGCDAGGGRFGAGGGVGTAGEDASGSGGTTGGASGTSSGGTGGVGTGGTGATGGVSTGGTGGTATGGTSSGGTGGVVPCNAGERRCSGSMSEVCVFGTWQQTQCTAPTPECVGGTCVVCSEGSGRCNVEQPERCSSDDWVAQPACLGDTFCQAGDCVTPPSCVGLAANCGSTAESCCKSIRVPGDDGFFRNNDGNYPATIGDFRIDKYEVSVGRFRKFAAQYAPGMLAAGAGAHPKVSGSGWDPAWQPNLPITQTLMVDSVKCGGYATWTDAAGANERLPIACTSWYLAFMFCAWDGGRLPTDLEWNYTAAGGTEQRKYPWGSVEPGYDASHAVYNCYYDGTLCPGSCCLASIAPVGSIPQGNGLWGHADLAGNISEWIFDGQGGYPPTCVDCAQVTGSLRVVRGGMFSSLSAQSLETGIREVGVASSGSHGFRCARDL
jgi:formylglycine-generating enzyme